MQGNMNLDRLNEALYIGLTDVDKQRHLDEGFDVIGKFIYDHGHIPDEAFKVVKSKSIYDCSKEDVIVLLLDDICNQVLIEPILKNTKSL